MAKIKAKKIPLRVESAEDTIARFCYHFPQYTFHEAKQMPFVRIKQMLKVARKEQALLLYDLTRIASAPHTEKGKEVKKLLQSYKEIVEDN